MEDKTMIEIKDLKKSFGKNIILDGVNEEVKKGQVICVIGPSGAGTSAKPSVRQAAIAPSQRPLPDFAMASPFLALSAGDAPRRGVVRIAAVFPEAASRSAGPGFQSRRTGRLMPDRYSGAARRLPASFRARGRRLRPGG